MSLSQPPALPPPTPDPKPSRPPVTRWSHHLPWIIPVVIVVALAAIVAFYVVASHALVQKYRAQPEYQEAMRRVACSPEVAQMLGTPVIDGSLELWGTHERDADGAIDLLNTLEGPSGEGMLDMTTQRTRGGWEFSRLLVYVEDGEQVSLVDAAYEDGGCPMDTIPVSVEMEPSDEASS